MTGAGNLTLQANSTGDLTLTTGVINNAGTITNSGSSSGTVTLSSVIGGNVTGITQSSGTSLLLLGGANTSFAGTVAVSSGTLAVTNSAALNSSNVVSVGAGGILDIRNNSETIAGLK